MPIFRGKRNKVGIQAKPRLKSEVNAEYNEHAARLGHAFRMIQEMEIETAKLEAEIKERVKKAKEEKAKTKKKKRRMKKMVTMMMKILKR